MNSCSHHSFFFTMDDLFMMIIESEECRSVYTLTGEHVYIASSHFVPDACLLSVLGKDRTDKDRWLFILGMTHVHQWMTQVRIFITRLMNECQTAHVHRGLFSLPKISNTSKLLKLHERNIEFGVEVEIKDARREWVVGWTSYVINTRADILRTNTKISNQPWNR